jgi:uncharacterized protein YukE
MVQVITNPREMVNFAEELGQLSVRMQETGAQLTGELTALKSVWDDKRYEEFNLMVTHASLQLEIFYAQSRRYIAYLNTKADAARRYLNR